MEFVLVHGTTQSPVGWDPLRRALTRRGHTIAVVDLASDRRELTVDDYAQLAAEQVGRQGDRRVVVAHSGSGVLLPALAGSVGAEALVWLAAYVPDFTGRRSLFGGVPGRTDRVVSARLARGRPVRGPPGGMPAPLPRLLRGDRALGSGDSAPVRSPGTVHAHARAETTAGLLDVCRPDKRPHAAPGVAAPCRGRAAGNTPRRGRCRALSSRVPSRGHRRGTRARLLAHRPGALTPSWGVRPAGTES